MELKMPRQVERYVEHLVCCQNTPTTHASQRDPGPWSSDTGIVMTLPLRGRHFRGQGIEMWTSQCSKRNVLPVSSSLLSSAVGTRGQRPPLYPQEREVVRSQKFGRLVPRRPRWSEHGY